MNTVEIELIRALLAKRLTKEDFLISFRTSHDSSKLTLELLEEAFVERETSAVEYALAVGFTFGFSAEHLDVLCRLSDATWHLRHEDVVTALGKLRVPDAVDPLYRAAQKSHDYLDFDESRALAVKAIWALGRIAGVAATEKLRMLAQSEEPILRDEALNQLRRREGAMGEAV